MNYNLALGYALSKLNEGELNTYKRFKRIEDNIPNPEMALEDFLSEKVLQPFYDVNKKIRSLEREFMENQSEKMSNVGLQNILQQTS